MITIGQYAEAARVAREYFAKAGIVLTAEECERIEVADFGLSNLSGVGLQLLTYVNTERVCAKEMVLTPGQICPQHRHVATAGCQGKEETFRCRLGKVYLYVGGDCNGALRKDITITRVNDFRETVLLPGDQYTLPPDTWHWFVAGDEGAVISEFSTRSTDDTDEFFDTAIKRATEIARDDV